MNIADVKPPRSRFQAIGNATIEAKHGVISCNVSIRQPLGDLVTRHTPALLDASTASTKKSVNPNSASA